MNNNEFEDIEQLLKPQCEFKASENLKQEVMEKARQEAMPRRIAKLWPWLAAACVIGFIMMILMPPKSATEEQPLMAKIEPKVVKEQPAEKTPEPISVIVETPKQPKVQKSRPATAKEEQESEPVQMSEETRMELLLAMASQNNEIPQMEEINIEAEIQQMRQRGEQMINMYEQNDK